MTDGNNVTYTHMDHQTGTIHLRQEGRYTMMDIQTIADLAKQGGRLSSDKQWVLADALAALSKTQIQQVASVSGRNESTLLQYARAAERWSPSAGLSRVEGVSFSAHRVALSYGSGKDPQLLLESLKIAHGSPTVKQVREAMGLEGHPAIEALNKGIKKLDRKVSMHALARIVAELREYLQELGVAYDDDEDDPFYTDEYIPTQEERTAVANEILDRHVGEDLGSGPDMEDEAAVPKVGTWQPPVSTSDIAGI